jgi:hypothetical protein
MNVPPFIASRHSTEDGTYEVTYYYITTVDACETFSPNTRIQNTQSILAQPTCKCRLATKRIISRPSNSAVPNCTEVNNSVAGTFLTRE